jgi:hypothetical protein
VKSFVRQAASKTLHDIGLTVSGGYAGADVHALGVKSNLELLQTFGSPRSPGRTAQSDTRHLHPVTEPEFTRRRKN